MKTKPKKTVLELTVRVTAKNIKDGWAKRFNGNVCPLALAITRTLKSKKVRGWKHNWVTWTDAYLIEDAKKEQRYLRAIIEHNGEYGMLRSYERRGVKPFTLQLVYSPA